MEAIPGSRTTRPGGGRQEEAEEAEEGEEDGEEGEEEEEEVPFTFAAAPAAAETLPPALLEE